MRGTCGSGGGSVHLRFCTSLPAASPVNVAPCPLWGKGWAEGSPIKNGHSRLPLPFGERVGVRGTCGSGGGSVHLRFCTSLPAASPVNVAPSPLWGKGWAEGSPIKNGHGRLPLPLGERVGVRGTCGSGGGSVHLRFCTSLSAASPVNV